MSAVRDAFVKAVLAICGEPQGSTSQANGREVTASDEKKMLQTNLALVNSLLAQWETVQKESQESKTALMEARSVKEMAVRQARQEVQSPKGPSALGARRGSTVSIVSHANSAPCVTSHCGSDPSDQLIGHMTDEALDAHFDLVIIGGGPVGVAAAIKCACLGHRAIIVDKPKLPPQEDGLDLSFGGPTGLFSKALRDTAKHVDVPSLQSMHMDDEVIWHQVRNMCLRLASSNASHQVQTLQNLKIDYVQGHATVINGNSVMLQRGEGQTPAILQTDHVLVATGSKPLRPKEIPFDDVRIFDSDTINTLSFLPKSVAILGSGIIAIEYAKIFRKLGVQVTMLVRSGCLSALERIGLDTDIAKKLIEVLREDDVEIFEGTTIEEFDVPVCREDGMIALTLNSSRPEVPRQKNVDVFLAATGRKPNTSGWGAEKLGVRLASKGGHIEVDDCYQSSVPNLFAAGDVIGPPSLASTGMYQAQAAVLEAFGEGHMNKFSSFPIGMWTTPECGYYGLTSAAAKKQGLDVDEGCVQYSACLRGRVFAPVGLLKLVFRVSDGVIVGVHILGDDACELVHYGMDLVVQGVSIFKVMTTCFTAVTFHELFREAALNGNSKLEFGLEWHKVLNDIGVHMDNHPHGANMEKMKELFEEMDEDKDGQLSESELMTMFQKYGCDVKRATVHNIVRLVEDNSNTVHWDSFAKIFDIMEDIRSHSHFGKESSGKDSGSPPSSPKKTSAYVNSKETSPKASTDEKTKVGDAQSLFTGLPIKVNAADPLPDMSSKVVGA